MSAAQRPTASGPRRRLLPSPRGAATVLALVAVLLQPAAGRATPPALPWGPREGVVVLALPAPEVLDRLGPVWYYQYGYEGPDLPGHHRVCLVPPHHDEGRLMEAVRQRPGAWWILGNEPNDPHQDHLSPAAYAAFYHRTEGLIRRADPTAHVVPAGIADADAAWAGAFREAYRAQYRRYPRVAAWNIHNYILDLGRSQYDLAEFQRRILAFRAWMADVGEGGRPLLLTEYGVLYGSGCCGRPVEPPHEGVAFMLAATRWLQETDHVQAWTWFSLDSRRQFHGDLLTPDGELSPFGRAYADLVAAGAAHEG